MGALLSSTVQCTFIQKQKIKISKTLGQLSVQQLPGHVVMRTEETTAISGPATKTEFY